MSKIPARKILDSFELTFLNILQNDQNKFCKTQVNSSNSQQSYSSNCLQIKNVRGVELNQNRCNIIIKY